MSNLLRKQRDELLAREIEELEGRTQEQIEEKAIQEEKPANPEEETFKKRYADLRRHLAAKEQEWQEEKKILSSRIEEKSVALPKTEEELSAWANKYPDLYKIFETMIMKREQAAISQMKEELKQVDNLKAEIARKEAQAILMKAHPDFYPGIAQSQDFHDWLATKSKAIRDIMYEDGADVNDAIDVVTLYKKVKGIGESDKKETKKTNTNERAEAAKTVTAPTRSAPTLEGEHIFSESEVAAMSEREYLKKEAEINKQMADGKFLYDLSGAAR